MDKKVPESFNTREELIHFLTIVIFTCSCQHAAVNFSQMATYGFHPNSPSLMRQPAPIKRGEVDHALIMSTLANKHQAGVMVFIMNALTTIYPNEVYEFQRDKCKIKIASNLALYFVLISQSHQLFVLLYNYGDPKKTMYFYQHNLINASYEPNHIFTRKGETFPNISKYFIS